jgi:glycosidase
MSDMYHRIMPFVALLLLAAGLSCSKHGAPAAGGQTTTTDSQDPPQYGTPYSQVPDPRDAIIYQVNMRAFSTAGNFAGVQARLDSIQALGVNVVYLMPVYPVGVLKSINSPYCIQYFDSVATEYGTLTDLRALVDGAHQRNMAVIFDWVAEQTSWDNPWIGNKTWYQQDGNGNIISQGSYTDVAALNFNSAPMRLAMIKAMKYWVYAANIDGFRCDDADVVPFSFWQQSIDTLRGITTHNLLLFAEGTSGTEYTAGFQLQYGFGFYYNMKNQIFGGGGSVKSIDSVNTVEFSSATGDDQVVRYTSNHDVDNTDGTPLTLFGGKQGSLAAFLVAAYMDGIPMIYDGQEVGCAVQLTYFNNSTPIDWSTNPDMTAEYKRIIAFRNGSDAVKRGSLLSFSSNDVCVFTKSYNNQQVLVIANLRNAAESYTMPSTLANTSWTNAEDGSSLSLGAQLSLQPYQYIILKNQ